MYAIVKTGGKQYRVERGQTLLVERLAAEEGANVALEPILYRSDEAVFDAAGLKKVKVTAKIVAHERGEKLRVFKFKPKRGYKRRTGHRQELTRIEVTDISMGLPPRRLPRRARLSRSPPSPRLRSRRPRPRPTSRRRRPLKPAVAKSPASKPKEAADGS